jgi:hypothetical protein
LFKGYNIVAQTVARPFAQAQRAGLAATAVLTDISLKGRKLRCSKQLHSAALSLSMASHSQRGVRPTQVGKIFLKEDVLWNNPGQLLLLEDL